MIHMYTYGTCVFNTQRMSTYGTYRTGAMTQMTTTVPAHTSHVPLTVKKKEVVTIRWMSVSVLSSDRIIVTIPAHTSIYIDPFEFMNKKSHDLAWWTVTEMAVQHHIVAFTNQFRPTNQFITFKSRR